MHHHHHVREPRSEYYNKLLPLESLSSSQKWDVPLERSSRGSRVDRFFIAVDTGDSKTVTLFLNRFPECTGWLDTDGRRALHHAVINKQHKLCKCMQESKQPLYVNEKDKFGRTPLRYAAANIDADLTKYLIEIGADADIKNSVGNTVLSFAASKGYTPICNVLIEYGNADISSKNHDGFTPLHHASANGHESACKLLLEKSADPNVTTLENSSPLHRAAFNNHIYICQLLLSSGADPNIQTNVLNTRQNGFTPLHFAAMKENFELCEILISEGADPSIQSTDGFTALSIATGANDKQIAKLLLDKADPNLSDNFGNAPLHIACETSNEEMCQLLLESSLINFGNAPLHIACEASNEEMCQLLLESSLINVNIRTQCGYSPLILAVMRTNILLCRLLLYHNADPNLGNMEHNRTPLHYACEMNNLAICQLLLENGANPNSTDMNGNTPLHTAAKQRPYVFEIQVLLVEKGTDMAAKNQFGDHAGNIAAWGRDEELEIERASQRNQYSRLLSKGGNPVDTVKLFFCGDPKAGKTSLKQSLTTKKPLFGLLSMFDRYKKTSEFDDRTSSADYYDSTPGIDVATENISKAGTFSMWDCAGQVEYHLTHGMFMGVDNSIFTLTYDIRQNTTEIWGSLKYWLSFIRAGHSPRQHSKPHVVIIASHLDQCKNKEDKAFRDAEQLLSKAKEKFGLYLNISSELVVIDARLPNGKGLETVKDILAKISKEIKGNKTVPTLCEEIKRVKKSWERKDYPVLSWSDYFQHVKETIDPLVSEDSLRIATLYLHDMGEVYFAELPDREHQVILNTKWFSYDIIGAAFAGEDFPGNFPKLPESCVYDRKQLKQFFNTSAETDLLIALLQHVGLLYKCGNDKFIIPGKLPDSLDKVCWRKEREFEEYHGRRVQCKEDIDIFAPDVFPCIQMRIMEEFVMIHEPASLSRSTLKFASESVEGMIQITKDKRAINIACRCRGEEDRQLCHDILEKVTRQVKLELIKRSPGTQTAMFYLSPRSLYAHDDLEGAWYYTEEDLTKGERNGRGSVKHHATQNTDKTSAILCLGHDPLFLQILRADCDVKWVPRSVKDNLYKCLDVKNRNRSDYRSLAEVLNITLEKLQQIEQTVPTSLTQAVIDCYCDKQQAKVTLRMLHNILSHPGLVDNVEAVRILDELLSERGIEMSEIGDYVPSDMPINHIAWRATLRKHWDTLRADIRPSLLDHPFLTEDEEEFIQAEEKNQGARKAADLLLSCLLQRHGWYSDFMISLKKAGCHHLTNMLEETHKQFMQTLPVVSVVKKKYHLAWTIVLENKTMWLLFRSTLVAHTLLPHLSFLTNENREAILDIEEELGLPSSADILHKIIRETNSTCHYQEFIGCLRSNGFADLADKLCGEIDIVLKGDKFKDIEFHSKSLFPLEKLT